MDTIKGNSLKLKNIFAFFSLFLKLSKIINSFA